MAKKRTQSIKKSYKSKKRSRFPFNFEFLLIAGLLFFGLYFLNQHIPPTEPKPNATFESVVNLFPAPYFSNQILEYNYYRAGYSASHKQSEFIFYISKAEYLTNNFKRKNDFRPDPLVNVASATLGDYRGSGYDRGHLLPADDMTFEEQALSETFYLSNMSPQVPELNQKVWLKLEKLVRSWVKEEGELLVITGPILEKEGYIKETIGKGQVTVPWAFYKVVFSLRGDRLIAFILPNEPLPKDTDLRDYVVTVRDVERQTGIDFFAELPEIWQDQWENQTSLSEWKW